jgi:hypothetical protein
LRLSCSLLVSFPFFFAFHFGACQWPWHSVQSELSKTWFVWMPFNLLFLTGCNRLVKQNTGLHLLLSWRMRGAIYLLPWYSLNAWAFSTFLYLRHLPLTINRWLDSLVVYSCVVYLTTLYRRI